MSAVLGAKTTAENMIRTLSELSDIKTDYSFQHFILPIAFKRLADITSYKLVFTDTLF